MRGIVAFFCLSIASARGMVLKPTTVPLAELLSCCVDACSRGCKVIQDVQAKRASGGDIGVSLKDEADVRSALTEADTAAYANWGWNPGLALPLVAAR